MTIIYSENAHSTYMQQISKVLGIYKYNGCLITPMDGKFKALGKLHDTAKDAENFIDNSFKSWKIC